jgi:hypothetical protein
MRVMVIVKATRNSEAGVSPSEALLAKMGKYTGELVAGFWLWQVKSMEEAVDWVRRCPDPMPGEDSVIEIRRVLEAEDFGGKLTPELRAP